MEGIYLKNIFIFVFMLKNRKCMKLNQEIFINVYQNCLQVLVCAHRYIIKVGNESQYGQGLCYVLSNSLEYDDTYEPCKGRSTAR